MPLTQVSSRAIEDTLRYVLGANGSSDYTFTGAGLSGAVNDPTLTLSRGHTYIFENRNSANAHPFYIKTSIANGGTNDAYNTGVTNNGGAGGTEIVFTVPHDAPDVLYYQCSSHSSMAGELKIAGAVADGSITEAKLGNFAVTANKLGANAVSSDKLASSSVTAAKIAAGNVDNTALGTDSVSTSKIQDNAVTRAEIADGAINGAKCENQSIGAEKLTDGTIDNGDINASANIAGSKLADNSISLAKLVHGDSNNDGKFLRANNGADPTFEAVSSDFVKISSTTMSGEASEFDLTFDTSTYNQFKIYICGLNLSYDANLYIRFRIGTSFDTGGNYYGGTIKKYSGGFDSSTYGGQHQSYGYLTNNVGGNDATYERWSGIIDILCGNSGGMPFLRHDSFYKDSASTHANTMGIVGYQNWNIISGIRVYASSGNINHGKFELYGIK